MATGLEAAQVLMQTVPRLIVVDLDIKWLSGRQLIEVLRRNPRTSFIPIVAVAGAVEDSRGIPLLLRPVAAEQLRALVDWFLPQVGHRDGHHSGPLLVSPRREARCATVVGSGSRKPALRAERLALESGSSDDLLPSSVVA